MRLMRMVGAFRARLRDEGEKGVSLILTALSFVAIVGITALVVDIGNANQRSRSAQSVSDASALAAAYELPTAGPARTVAAEYVADNIDDSLGTPVACDGTESDVTADTICYEVGSRTIQITTPWDGNVHLIRVEVCDEVSTTFSKIFGFGVLDVCRHAIGEVEPASPGSPGGPAIQAFGPNEKKGFETTGNGSVWTDGDINIASTEGEAFLADGAGGVTLADGAIAWWDVNGGGCAKPPECGTPGFTPPENVVGCDPATDCPGGADHFQDAYLNSAPRSIVFADLQACLENDFPAGCEFYDPGGSYPVHATRSGTGTSGPGRTGDVTNPSCFDGTTTMQPGYYSTPGQYSIQGCVDLEPGIYMFAGGFDIEANAYVRGVDVLLINAADGTVSRITKSAVCLSGIEAGSFENFLYYQNPLNDGTFDVESDSVLVMAGIIYNPSGPVRIQGAATGTVGGDGTPDIQCLGQTVIDGGSIAGLSVLVKSDGMLSINAFDGGAASGGKGWVRLFE